MIKNENNKIQILRGADAICKFVEEDPKQILNLITNEGLPAWKRNEKGPWRALNIDLQEWVLFQRNKYLKDTPKYFMEKGSGK